jgi:hypothetical protein
MAEMKLNTPIAYTVAVAAPLAAPVAPHCAIRAGRLRALKHGRRTTILASDLLHWLESMTPVAPIDNAQRATTIMPAVDFEGIKAAALRSARSAIGAPSDAVDLSGENSTGWWCFHRRRHLTLRDRQFIEDLTDRHRPLSPKQQKWPCDIRERPERGAAT